ncbi:hypothetical protein FRC05_001090 [Tulasnella sp. 425]|nr:hypothetical protein FRC05_001090 [Tulasnella sp. 425]
MVTTRGKTIKFELDSSEGELDGENNVEKPVKLAAKRRRTKKAKSEDDDLAFAPSSSSGKGKDKATPDQNVLITRRGGKGGKLRDLMNMPVDIFTEVCSYLDPFDLRRLALTSKRLWDILMTKEARHIWKIALDSVPDLPECPTDLNEPQYVCLLYSSECYTIGCTGRGTRADWYFRVRFCTACHDANMANEWAVQRDSQLGLNVKYNIWSVIRYFCESSEVMSMARSYRRGGYRRGGRNEDKHIYVDEVKKLVSQYEALPQAEIEEYLSRLREKRNYRIETGKAMLKWKCNQLASRADDIAAEKSARFESIKVKLLDMGWDENDFPITNKDFRDLVFKDQKLTPKIWQNIQPKLEPLLQASRTERLEDEKMERQYTRENAIRKFYHQIGREVMDLPFEVSNMGSFLPSLSEISALPSVKPLLEADTETVTEEQWIEVAPDVRLVVVKWWRDTLRRMVDALENGTTQPPNETDKGDEGTASAKTETQPETGGEISSNIDEMRTKLSYATSVFYCRSSWCKRIWWFPYGMRHGVSYHSSYKINELLEQVRPLQPEGQELVKRLVKDLKLDPTVKSSEIVVEDQNQKTFLCTRCDERTAKHMNFTELIEHYLNVKKWFDEVTEAVRTQPDSCYPSRAVNSGLPKIVNDHDWISNDALLVRQDDEETKKTVLELQKAFRKECLTDPAYDTQGIGGEDLEKNPGREVIRCCKLCPKTYAPDKARVPHSVEARQGTRPGNRHDVREVLSVEPVPFVVKALGPTTQEEEKIKFELDSSEGELVGEKDVQQPAAKRRRTKKSKSEDDDPAFAPSSSSEKGKDKATPDQNMLITRRGGKGGKLRDLMNMPVDIFTELVTMPSMSYISPFPDISLIHLDMCISMAGESAVYTASQLGLKVEYNAWHEIKSFCKNSSAVSAPSGYLRGGRKYIYVDEVKKLVSQYEALPQTEAEEYLSQLRIKRNYRIETEQAMLQWKSNQLASRADDIAAGKSARFESIKVKLLEMGWDQKDFPITNKDFSDLVLKDQKLTPKVWQNIKPKLELLLEASRADRLDRERRQRQSNRKHAIRKFYSQIGREVIGLPFDCPLVSSFVPRVDEIPSIKPLLEDDTETVTEEQWIEVAPDAQLVVLKGWRDTLKLLINHLENGAMSSSNKAHKKAKGVASGKTKTKAETKTEPGTETETDTEEEILSSIDAMKTKLSYATSLFYRTCESYRRAWWFPKSIRHARPSHHRYSLNQLLDQLRPAQPEVQELVKRLLKDFGLDPETVKASEIDTGDQNQKTYLCVRCHEKTAEYMTFPELIEHYLNVKRWFDNVTEAIRTQPDSCYPSRPVNSELSKIVNDHDWISSDALLVRQDDVETRKTVLGLQKAFRKECLTDPACDTEGIGGEDLENHSWREVLRCCKLCPRTYAPPVSFPLDSDHIYTGTDQGSLEQFKPCNTRTLEIHIRSKHGKEPDLETDTTLKTFYSSNQCPL